jgi:hypothetical protein
VVVLPNLFDKHAILLPVVFHGPNNSPHNSLTASVREENLKDINMYRLQNRNLWIGLIIPMLFLLSNSTLKAATSDPDLASAIGASIVFDTDGNEYRLGNAWESKPVVLVFIRHFG